MSGDNQKQNPQATQPANWQFKTEGTAAPSQPTGAEVSWSASEFIAHHKDTGWYGMLFLGTAALSGIIYLITQNLVTVAIIIIVAVLFGIAANAKPRTLKYHLDSHGLTMGNKFYPYSQFKSFAVVPEGAFASIWFLPLKRFMPPLTIYYSPGDEEKIMAVLSDKLPLERHQMDAIDRFASRVRF